MLGEPCLLIRVERATNGGRPRLLAALSGPESELRAWKKMRLFDTSQALLVLRSQQRQALTLDRPLVADEELAAAMRWPLGEALDTDPEQLLSTALSLPTINDSARSQVLAVAAPLAAVREQVVTLKAAGVAVQSIDIIDSALRGMVQLHIAEQVLSEQAALQQDGWVAMATIAGDICIGLIWQGQFCALRSLALPVREPRDRGEFAAQLALHIQRTTDTFERQATRLAIRHVLASLPALPDEVQAAVREAMPLRAALFDVGQAFEASPAVLSACTGHPELTALACTAAARLNDLFARRAEKLTAEESVASEGLAA